jgi:hypothetical protein
MLSDLVTGVLFASADLPDLRDPRSDPNRFVGLDLRADDLALPLPVALELI